jgi:hypothetical protein
MNQYDITKQTVRSSFKYQRELMRQAENFLSAKGDIDFQDAEQLAMELTANSSIFDQWLLDMKMAGRTC